MHDPSRLADRLQPSLRRKVEDFAGTLPEGHRLQIRRGQQELDADVAGFAAQAEPQSALSPDLRAKLRDFEASLSSAERAELEQLGGSAEGGVLAALADLA